MATSSRGGSPYDQTPVGSGMKEMQAESAAITRQQTGKNPSVTLGQIAHGIASAAFPQHTVALNGKTLPVNAGIVFTPGTAAAQAVLQAPGAAKAAHQQAVNLAHPSKQNPPSLGREVNALLSGALGLPRMGEGKPTVPGRVSYTKSGIPRVPKGTATVGTGGEAGQQIREGLRGAKKARTVQEQLYSQERSKRAGAAERAAQEAGGGVAGYKAALGELKGPLQKIEFGGLQNIDQESLDTLFSHIQTHPTLRPYEKIRTQGALLGALGGKVPTRSELDLLQRAFGREVANRVAAQIPTLTKIKKNALDTLNVPRALMASMDLSAPFRQGLVAMGANPKVFFKNFSPMVKAFGSQKVYDAILDDIHSRPSYPKMREAGVSFTELGPLENREEQFMSNFAERIPLVRGSSRAYTGFLDKTRADLFDYYLQKAQQQGVNTNDPKIAKSIAKFVNSATGRGDLGALKNHAVTLNTLFFSPRLLASRVNFLNPVYYASLDPFARKQALLAAFKVAGVLGTTLTLAKLAGAKVNTDPRNADFAKIKIGDTRIDVLGGFQQPMRLIAQLASGKIVSSTTGKTLSLGPEGPGKLSRFDIALRFAEQKLAPAPSLIVDFFKGTDFADKPFSWKRAMTQRMIPLLMQDVADLHRQYGNDLLDVGGYALGGLGFGLQTYAPTPPKTPGSTRNPYLGGGSSGGGSAYDQSPVGGGSPYSQPAVP